MAEAGIEQHLLDALKYGGLDKENLAELVKIAGRIPATGAKVIKGFPYGIPYPDGVVLHTMADATSLGRLVHLLTELPRVAGVEIFPKGIPRPDVFLTNIQLR
jgi:hypothetical protein